jgi:hypothetical protein
MSFPADSASQNEPSAGPDLDRQIERLVFSLEPREQVPPYSTDDATASALATRFCQERGWWHFEKKEVFGGWSVGWIEEGQPYLHSAYPIRASASTRALAICRSLLKVAETVPARGRSKSRSAERVPLVRI